MEKIKNFAGYKQLISETKQNFGKLKTNSFLMKSDVSKYLEEERLFFERTEQGLIFYLDEGTYRKVFYHLGAGESFPQLSADKKLLLEELDSAGRREQEIEEISKQLKQNGWSRTHCSWEYEFFMDGKAEELQTILADKEKRLADTNYRVLRLHQNADKKEEVLKLWKDALKDTDFPLNHLQYEKNEEDTVFVVADSEGAVCAADWMNQTKGNSEGRHIVTGTQYHRKGFASLLLYRWLYEASRNQAGKAFTWIAEDNLASIQMHEKIGFTKGKKCCIQFSLESNN